MDLDGVGRILNAVGREFVPADVDKRALLRRLQWTASWGRIKTESAPRMGDWKKRRAQIKRAAAKLQRLLSDNRAWLRIPGGQALVESLDDFIVEPAPERLPDSLERLEQGAKDLKKRWRTVSDLEWIAGHHLLRIFEQFLARRAGRSRVDGAPSGPCVRFISAAMKELKMPRFKRESIIRAMTDARKPPGRRRQRSGRNRTKKSKSAQRMKKAPFV
jgi:hypothetical protein